MKLKDFLATAGLDGNRELLHDAKGEQYLAATPKTNAFGESNQLSTAEYLEICRENGMEPEEDPADIENNQLSVEDRATRKAAWLTKMTNEGKAPKVMQKDRIVPIRASDETVDRSGDIVRVDGWALTDFKKNPVFLDGHDYSKAPLGRVVKVWKENADGGSANGKSLMIRVYFPPAEISEKADAAYRGIVGKLFNAVSVGFMPEKINNPTDQEERDTMGLGKWGVEFLKQKLWEVSLVTVPANQNALVVNSAEHQELCVKLGVPFKKEGEPSNPNVTPVTAVELSVFREEIKSLRTIVLGFQETIGAIEQACIEILTRMNKQPDEGGSGSGQKDPKAPAGDSFNAVKGIIDGLDFKKAAA